MHMLYRSSAFRNMNCADHSALLNNFCGRNCLVVAQQLKKLACMFACLSGAKCFQCNTLKRKVSFHPDFDRAYLARERAAQTCVGGHKIQRNARQGNIANKNKIRSTNPPSHEAEAAAGVSCVVTAGCSSWLGCCIRLE